MAEEIKMPIPARLKNVAVGGHVAGAEDIVDDTNFPDNPKNQAEINAEVNTTLETYGSAIEGLDSQKYVSVDSYSALPSSGSVDTVYRVGSWDGTQVDATKYAEYAWNDDQGEYVLLSVKTQVGEVFDISAYHSGETYADIAAALDGGNNVPEGIRKGGMSIKFVQTSDNTYVQYRLMSDTFNTTVANWQGIDGVPTAGSDNLVKSGGVVESTILEKEHSVLDEDVAGYITDKCNVIIGKIMKKGSIVFLELNDRDKAIDALLDNISVDVPQLSNIVKFITDKEGRIIASINNVGDTQFYGGGGFDGEISYNNAVSFNAVKVLTDRYGYIILWIDIEGKVHISDELKSKKIFTENLELSEKGLENLKKDLNIDNTLSNDISSSLDKVFNMPIPHPVDNNGKELYSELSVFNVERRANQYRFIRWTALSPIPKNASVGGYYTGQQTGLPYASCMEIDKFVGYDISFMTFMTAANNPYSMLYTENLRDNGSVYGFTYHTGRSTIAGWAGIVCNVMENYSTGMKIPYDTGMWAYLASIGRLVKIYKQEAQGLRLGDFLWQSGHGRMVQNLWRDNNGLVESVEAVTGGLSNPEYMFDTPEAFDEDLEQRKGIIYRNTELYKNTEYQRLPFTLYSDDPLYREIHDLDDSGEDTFPYNNDICTFAGDYACFREGFRIVINYNLKEDKSWSTIELYKNDSLYGTYELSEDTGTYDRGPENYPEEMAELIPSHSFDLSFLNLTYGKYKARLVREGSIYSDFTYFEILDTNASYVIQPDSKTKIFYNSKEGTPLYIRWSKDNGGPKGLYELSDEEIEQGYCVVDVADLISKQYNNYYSGNTYLKVYFKGEYGCVTNAPILYK